MSEYFEPEEPRQGIKRLIFFLSMVFILVAMIVIQQGYLLPGGGLYGQPKALLTTPATHGLAYNRSQIRTEDSKHLIAWLVPYRKREQAGDMMERLFLWLSEREAVTSEPGGTVLILGDGRQDKTFFLPYTLLFNQLGYSVVLFDYRGCGDSEGAFTLDGALADTLNMIQEIRRNRAQDKLALLGIGIGANLALEATLLTELASPGSIAALVLDTPVHSLKEYHRRRIHDRFGRFASLLVTRWRPLETVLRSPRDLLSELPPLPIFWMHSELEPIPSRQTADLCARKATVRNFWLVPDCRLGEAAIHYPLETAFLLGRFLDPYLLGKPFDPDPFVHRATRLESGGTLVEFHPSPAFSERLKAMSVPVAVEAYVLAGNHLYVEQGWVSRESPLLSVAVDERPSFALASARRFVEPVFDQTGKVATGFVLSQCSDEKEYWNRMGIQVKNNENAGIIPDEDGRF